MAEVVRMPKLSDTMKEGVVAAWHKKVGEKVDTGDLLAEIETDKATMEFESFQEGVLLHIGVEAGKAAPVDAILAILGDKGEKVDEILAEEAKLISAAARTELKEEEPKSKPAPISLPKAVPVLSKATESAQPENSQQTDKNMKASPLAKKLAKERGLNLSMIRGTGENGRIIRRDIEEYSGSDSIQKVERYREVEVTQMRKVIASRLGESKFSAPHFYLTMDISMDNMVEARTSINLHFPTKISLNDIVIKAVAEALKDHPECNSSWLGDRIRINDHVHIGVAVAVEDGLLVPVIRHADSKRLTQISSEVKHYAGLAKDKKLQPADWEGNTFTISNLGMFDIEEFTAIINPPDACILAIGGVKEVPVVANGEIKIGKVMKVTLSCDHRVVDGVAGSKFLNTFKKLMENPIVLLGGKAV